MIKSKLIKIIAKKTETPAYETAEIINTFLDEILRTLQNNEKVVLTSFGTFHTAKRAEKILEKDGLLKRRIVIPAHRAAYFTMGKKIKKYLSKLEI